MGLIAGLIEDRAFDQQAIDAMIQAGTCHHRAQPDADKAMLARTIIAVAKTGERDLVKLSATVLNSLSPSTMESSAGLRPPPLDDVAAVIDLFSWRVVGWSMSAG